MWAWMELNACDRFTIDSTRSHLEATLTRLKGWLNGAALMKHRVLVAFCKIGCVKSNNPTIAQRKIQTVMLSRAKASVRHMHASVRYARLND